MTEHNLAALRAKAHKTMTREEYDEWNIKGWHEVCHDVDGFGGTGIRYLGTDRGELVPAQSINMEMLAALKNLIKCLDLAEEYDDLPLPFVGYGNVFIDEARTAITHAQAALREGVS